ncbi:metallophosphoesterase [Pedobacter sp. L105]|uniref:metallophosphoesterase family protein n=1 Tax=Pedobacter sp. L105 TaxID=1641871 RepID=UPI00131C5324|nr:metallophosphoesterase family protein [Pedobacter sp. L105]
MKIALFSDIHANLPAFQAMLQDMEKRKPDAIYCLGDLVGYHIWPNEVIAEIRRRGIATLAGNHDQKVEKIITIPDSLKEAGKNYAYHLIDQEGRNYLKTLPAHIKLDYQLAEHKMNLVFAHGSTRSIDEYILEDTNEAYVLDLLKEANADVLCIGHSHKPYHRVILAENGEEKNIINIGSVGKPKDGNPQGCYVLLTINIPSTPEKKQLEVEFIRFDYDVEKAARAIEDSLLPDEFADRLRKAY